MFSFLKSLFRKRVSPTLLTSRDSVTYNPNSLVVGPHLGKAICDVFGLKSVRDISLHMPFREMAYIETKQLIRQEQGEQIVEVLKRYELKEITEKQESESVDKDLKSIQTMLAQIKGGLITNHEAREQLNANSTEAEKQ